MRVYVQAYFFQARQQFLNLTAMTPEEATQFLRINIQASLFASKMLVIQQEIATEAKC